MAKPSVALRLGLEGEETITSGFERIAASGDAAAKRIANDFERASAELDRALDRRNFAAQKVAAVSDGYSFGADQNAQVVAFQRQMKLQQEQANALRDALNPLAVAQRRYDEEIATYNRLLRATLLSEEEHAEAVRRSTQALAAARAENTRGAANDNARRASIQNLGFQMQDFAVQVVGGTSVLRAFAQQAPQAAGALTGFGGKLGAVGAFLNGPWGIALTLGTTLLAGFADRLLSSGDAGDAAKSGLDRYSNSLVDLRRRAQEADQALQGLNATAGQRRVNEIGDLRRDRLLAEGRLTPTLLAAAQAPTRVVYGVDTTAAIQRADAARREVDEIKSLIAVKDLQIRIAERSDARIRAEEASTRAATDARKAEIATNKAAAASRREDAEARRDATKAAREQRAAEAIEEARLKAAYEQRVSDMIIGAPSIATQATDPRANLDKINRWQDDQKEAMYQKEKARIAGVAEFYRSAFTGAGQSIGQTLKNVLLDAVTTALAKFTVKQIGGLLDNAGGFLKSLGIGRPAANAAGTNYFTGGMTWVAENGPELISLPRGSRVTNAADTRRLMSAANDRAPVSQYFDLRGAVVTEDLYARMMAIGDAAAVRGAAGGSQMAQAEMTASGERKLGRSWR